MALAQTFAIVGPNWQGRLPAGVKEYRSPTSVGWIVGRVLLYGAADTDKAHGFQAQVTARPLSAWGRKDYVPPVAKGPAMGKRVVPVDYVAHMDPADYYSLFTAVTAKNPPHPQDNPELDRLARLGLVPGQPFDLNRQPADVQEAFRKGAQLSRCGACSTRPPTWALPTTGGRSR